MIISYSPYTLRPVQALNALSKMQNREGALIRVQWTDGRVGYADLHPWPELGDLPMDEQLALLRSGKMSTLAEQAIWMARRDADLRKLKKNYNDEGVRVRNNFTISDYSSVKEGDLDQIKKEGFHCVKVKAGRHLEEESQFLARIAQRDLTIRLDMNGMGSWHIFKKFIAGLDPKTLAKIEYVEDPFPYDEAGWCEANALVKIALDNQYDRVHWDLPRWRDLAQKPFDVLILKPAKQDVDVMVKKCQDFALQMTVTSYMGHPVGMIHNLALAMELKKKHSDMLLDPGCMTHRLYHMEAFAAEVQSQGPFVVKVPGAGIGFDSLLENQSWYQLKLR